MSLSKLLLDITAIGSEWVLWLLVLLSIGSMAVAIERLIYFRVRRVNADELGEELGKALRMGRIDVAKGVVRGSRAIESLVVLAGLNAVGRGLDAVAEAMLCAKARERVGLEANLFVLGTLGNNAPFVGLFGTVIGIIRASIDLSEAQAAKEAAGAAVMSGVFEALVATAVGLLVALPAVAAFNYFQRKVRIRLLQTDVLAHLVLSFLKDPKLKKDEPASPARQNLK